MKNLWSFGLSDIQIILVISREIFIKKFTLMLVTKGRGWDGKLRPQPTSDSSSTQLLHLALAGLELDHQPPTQELINEG